MARRGQAGASVHHRPLAAGMGSRNADPFQRTAVSDQIEYRRHDESDRNEVFSMFRGSVFDFVRQIGLVGPDDHDDIAAAWERQGPTAVHLENTAAEDWVALAETGVVGWARSVERDGHVQLTHFFVDPSTQGRGVGRGLLERAFPLGLGRHRSIMATQNPLALGLYLRFGVEFQGQTFEIGGRPVERPRVRDVELERSELTDEICAIDAQILGFDRRVDLEFLAGDRPLFLAASNGATVGYAFGSNGTSMGPAGAVEPSFLPGILAGLDTKAAANGIEHVRYTLPGPASAAIRWALESGHHIDPFYEVLLADTPRIELDRYLMTQPGFIW